MKSAIITGANGQDGYYLQELLKRESVDAVLVSRASGIDLANAVVVSDLVANTRPDYVFHLAAKSTLDHKVAGTNHGAIASGAFNLLEAVRKWVPECKVFLAGSAYQFKNEGEPIKETDPWDTTSVYCAARGYSNLLARAYRSMGFSVYFGYFFHHDSPRRGAKHLSQKIAQAARNKQSIEIGDLRVVKEWTHASDTVEAVWTLVNQQRSWEANIGTGIGHNIEDFVEACFAAAGLDYREFVTTDPSYVAPYRRLTCDPSRIYRTGWKPRHGLEYLAEQMVNV
jgi:GDPmannose 4,6-dehydratase